MSLLKRRFEMDSEERLLAYWEADRKQSSAQWTKGDLLLGLEDESLMEFSEHVNDSYQTLKKYRWVASRYNQVLRRTNLSYSHHELVAAREDRVEWLKKAEENRWSVRTMLEEIQVSDRAKNDYESLVNQGKMVVAEGRAALTALVQGVLADYGDDGLVRLVEDIHLDLDPEELVIFLEADALDAYERAMMGR
jgi:hypothetical protein